MKNSKKFCLCVLFYSFFTLAIQKMNKSDKGFFLIVEESQIDKAAIEFAKKDKNALVVITGDHAIGVLAMGTRGKQSFHPEVIKETNHSSRNIEEEILKCENIDKVIK